MTYFLLGKLFKNEKKNLNHKGNEKIYVGCTFHDENKNNQRLSKGRP